MSPFDEACAPSTGHKGLLYKTGGKNLLLAIIGREGVGQGILHLRLPI